MKRLGIHTLCCPRRRLGDAVSEQKTLQAPSEWLAIRTNMPATVPGDVAKTLQFGDPAPAGMSEDKKIVYSIRERLDSRDIHGFRDVWRKFLGKL